MSFEPMGESWVGECWFWWQDPGEGMLRFIRRRWVGAGIHPVGVGDFDGYNTG